MAFNKNRPGERLNLITGNVRPYGFTVGNYAAPRLGDLVKLDTSGNGLVMQATSGDVPLGLLWSVNNNNGTLSILELRDCDLILPYTGTFAVGDKVVANGTTSSTAATQVGGINRDIVKHDNTNGIGTVIAKDVPGTGLAVVRFA